MQTPSISLGSGAKNDARPSSWSNSAAQPDASRSASSCGPAPAPGRGQLWTGRALSGLFALFMLGASVTPKLLGLPVVEASMAELGWPPGYGFFIGLIELGCVVLYLVPRTSILGATLTMSLLGGAIATQLRAGNPLFSHVLFPIYMGVLVWGGLWLRTPRLRALFPIVHQIPRIE